MKHFDNKHGFGKKHSCETRLLSTVPKITSPTAKGKQVDGILLDFEKAFDKLAHSMLLYKLDNYGVRDNTKMNTILPQPKISASHIR